MATYADTSFLFSLFVHDANTAAALAWLEKHPVPIPLTDFQRCELENAIRLAVFRRSIDSAAAAEALRTLEADVAAGNLFEQNATSSDLFAAAGRIGAAHTSRLGIRTLDLLHLGLAVHLRSKLFLTFDARQREGAKAVGLRIGP